MSDFGVIKHKRQFGKETLRTVLDNQGGICPYCGKEVDLSQRRGVHWSLDHVVPYCIYKWLEHVLSGDALDRLWDIFNSIDNVVITHHKCNIQKNSDIPTDKSIDEMFLPDDMKENIKSIKNEAEPYIDMYKSLTRRLGVKQGGRCLRCNKIYRIKDMTIRRLDLDKPRTEDNACLLCFQCNMVAGHGMNRNRSILISRLLNAK